MTSFLLLDLKYLLPEIFLSFSALVILMTSLINKKIEKLSNIFCIFSFLITVALIYFQKIQTDPNFFKYFVSSDNFINFSKIIFLLGAVSILFIYQNSYHNKNFAFEFQILIMFSVVGMMVMISANDFINFYLGIELQSLCLYMLAAFDRDNEKSVEAGIKYFVLGAIFSGIMLFGISLLYGFAGSTNFYLIQENIANINQLPLGILIGLIMVIIGLGFKISASPFHIWTPDVYQGSPIIVTSFLASVAKSSSILLLARLLIKIFPEWINSWQQIICFMSILSMLIGSIGALKQTSLKRILAYSGIAHTGYMLIALAAAKGSNDTSMIVLIVYLIIYLATNIGIFAFLSNFSHQDDISIDDLKGLAKTCPYSSICLVILLLSLAGIPPIAGFFTKFYVFSAAIKENLYITVTIAIISSVISSYYYLKIIKTMYFEESDNSGIALKSNISILTISSLINIFFFSFIDKLYKFFIN